MRILSIFCVLLIISLQVSADAIGSWQTHLAYNNISQIEPAGSKVFAISSGSLFSYNLNDKSIEVFSKEKGLSETSISKIKWCQSAKALIVTYTNSNIDVIYEDGSVENIPEIYSKQMTGDKTINDIYIYGRYAYLCAGFGLIKLDVKNAYITDTYKLSVGIKSITLFNNNFYAISSKGILKANISSNLYDTNSWTTINTTDSWRFITVLNNELVAIRDGFAGTINTSTGEETLIYQMWCLAGSTVVDGYVSGLANDGKYMFIMTPNVQAFEATFNHNYALTSLVYDKTNKCYWGNDSIGALVNYSLEGHEMKLIGTGVKPDGPASNKFWRLTLNNGKLYSASGRWCYNTYYDKDFEVQVFDGNNWSLLSTEGQDTLGHVNRDANCIVFDPSDNNHMFVGARSGLYEYRNGKFVKNYNNTNSNVESSSDKPEWCIITSAVYDNEGNLWFMNTHTDNVIKCLTKSGEIKKYPHDEVTASNKYARDYQKAFISATNGYMWCTNTSFSNSALIRYDYKNDKIRLYKNFINQDNTSLGTPQFYGCAEDKAGNIWVASDAGPIYLAAENINTDADYYTQYKVPRNDGTNYADYLLNNIKTSVIAVDASNRKWIGTHADGVYVISSDNNTQLYHFTVENSELLSNIINDILIDDQTGKVYIASEDGLNIYQSDIMSSSFDMSEDNVYAYPNPVTPEFTGNVTIVGLEPGCSVKILSVSGNLVNQGKCNGGSYEWNCCNQVGKRVASGVYMVNVAKSDGSSGVVTKIAIVR